MRQEKLYDTLHNVIFAVTWTYCYCCIPCLELFPCMVWKVCVIKMVSVNNFVNLVTWQTTHNDNYNILRDKLLTEAMTGKCFTLLTMWCCILKLQYTMNLQMRHIFYCSIPIPVECSVQQCTHMQRVVWTMHTAMATFLASFVVICSLANKLACVCVLWLYLPVCIHVHVSGCVFHMSKHVL